MMCRWHEKRIHKFIISICSFQTLTKTRLQKSQKMNKKILLTTLLTGTFCAIYAQDPRESYYYYEVLNPKHETKPKVEGTAKTRVKESIDRGLTATPAINGKGIYLSWRLLKTDGDAAAFHVYREADGKTTRLTVRPIVKTCDFTDPEPANNTTYRVENVNAPNGTKNSLGHSSVTIDIDKLKQYSSIAIQGNETPGKIAIADLNGDGAYDYIVRTPNSNVDPGMPGDKTGRTYKIAAYLSDGTHLWTIDLGPGIEPGVWYSPFVAFDFNGDGRAEVAFKSSGDDYVKDGNGRVCGGKEYLTIVDGMTGRAIDRVGWPERNARYGNLVRQNRNQIGVAYLDGKTPFLLAARGTYKLMVVDAWTLESGKLRRAWRWDGDEENPVIRSMGAHSMVTGDVDGDGRDEILLGSCMLDDDGTALWSSGLGHSDKAYLCRLRKDLPLQVFMVSEPKKEDGRGVSVVDAATGKLQWSIGQTTFHVGSGMVADFDPQYPGLECFSGEDRKGGSTEKYLLTADGKRINVQQKDIPGCGNWVWWDGDLLRETFTYKPQATKEGGPRRMRYNIAVCKWKGETLTEGIEGGKLAVADIDGDWREEIITALPGELRIYRTNIPAQDRRITLMQDHLYRSYIAHGSMGYPQAPVPSFYLGE